MFEDFPKISRLSREAICSEKIDGTNAQVYIEPHHHAVAPTVGYVAIQGDYVLYAGSRSRSLQPTKNEDNFGFAAWVRDHAAELTKLGYGRHFGEWWGQGIQRGYSLKEKRFSLFNTERWSDDAVRPACCHVVPVLARGEFCTNAVLGCLAWLELNGSAAAPGFPKPEGVVVYHTASRQLFKKTIERDIEPKSAHVRVAA